MRTRGQVAKARASSSSDEDGDAGDYSDLAAVAAKLRSRGAMRAQNGIGGTRQPRHHVEEDDDGNEAGDEATMEPDCCEDDNPSAVNYRGPGRSPYGGNVAATSSHAVYNGTDNEATIRSRRTTSGGGLNPPPALLSNNNARKGRSIISGTNYSPATNDFIPAAATTSVPNDLATTATGSAATRSGPHLPFETGIEAQGILSSLTDVADYYVSQFPIVLKIAEPLGLRPLHVPLVAVALISLVLGVFDNIISNAIGFFYPAWQSFKAVESPSRLDDRQWLTYWVVYAFFSFVEIFGDYLLAWVPFYYLVKVVFLLWLFLPQTKGASVMYTNFIRPFLLKYEDRIDSAINTMARNSQRLLKSTVSTATAPAPPPQLRFSAAATAKLKRVVFG